MLNYAKAVWNGTKNLVNSARATTGGQMAEGHLDMVVHYRAGKLGVAGIKAAYGAAKTAAKKAWQQAKDATPGS